MIFFGGNQKISLGAWGEEFAQKHYKKQGFKILGANVFNRKGKRLGELDFIAKNKSQIIFVEVKTRSSREGKFGTGAEAVHFYKQQRILKAVKLFLINNPKFQNLEQRIDVCVVIAGNLDKEPQSVTIIPNAVEDWT